ncbi:hypothetical protein [Aureibacillus halotolerans]|uniref:Uncharacterized protein n=1 Tax=Aureibacillus halotolerans TaxID=1508390 RepID=A0A4R6U154_9BACI|nr:hypothetical protein [Aureibacillus halotolerans]TDQ36774.1 hypothetical protein EV213_11673 [Aureibacillus halotolerans]
MSRWLMGIFFLGVIGMVTFGIMQGASTSVEQVDTVEQSMEAN